jgi:hypothetical protein
MTGDAVADLAKKILSELGKADRARLAKLIAPDSPVGELSQVEFDQACQWIQNRPGVRRFSEKSIEAARQVLVMGASLSEAAGSVGTTRQGVEQMLARFRARMADAPPGWVLVEAYFPPGVAHELKELNKRLIEDPAGLRGASFGIEIDD